MRWVFTLYPPNQEFPSLLQILSLFIPILASTLIGCWAGLVFPRLNYIAGSMIGFVVGFPAFGLMFWIAIRWFDVGQFAIPQSISVVFALVINVGICWCLDRGTSWWLGRREKARSQT